MATPPILDRHGRPTNGIPAAPVVLVGQAKALTVQYSDGTMRATIAGQVFAALMTKPDLRALDGVVAEDVVRGRACEAIRATEVFLEELLADNARKAAAAAAPANEAGPAPTSEPH